MKNIIRTTIMIFLFLPLIGQAQDFDIQKVEKVPGSINSDAEELKPILSPDGTVMYYVRSGHKKNKGLQDIWKTNLVSKGQWSTPTNNISLNNEANNAIVGYSYDGKRLYCMSLSSNKGFKKYQGVKLSIYEKDSADKWALSDNIKLPHLNPEGDHFDIFLTQDENYLVVSMQTEGSYTLSDLFVYVKQVDGSWFGPLNLGLEVNSEGHDFAPFLANDGKTLFFASTGHGGYGSADLFMTYRLDNSWTHWSKPKNMGELVNSKGFDAYFYMSEASEFYYSSNKENNITNLYRTEIDFKGYDPMKQQEGLSLPTVAAGLDSATQSQIDRIGAFLDQFGSPEEFMEKMNEIQQMADLVNDTKEILEELKKRGINNATVEYMMYFEFNSSSLSAQTKQYLEAVAKDLKNDPEINVMLIGHCDYTGSEKYNEWLSEKRAGKCKEYLISLGVPKSRISTAGMGEKEPIANNNTESGRSKNRRVTVVYVKDNTDKQ